MARFTREYFPDRAGEIDALYLSSLEFRELCHDFGFCGERISELENSDDVTSESAKQRIEQLRELQRELEAEIIEQLNAGLTTHGN